MVFGWPSCKMALGLYNKTAVQFAFGFYRGLDYDWVVGFWAGLANDFCFGLLSWPRYEFDLRF